MKSTIKPRQQRHEDGADERAKIAPAAAQDRRAADDDRRYDRHKVGIAHALISLVRVADEEKAAETSKSRRPRRKRPPC